MGRMSVRHLRQEDLAGLVWRGLVRESTAEQADGWSPERQRSDIRRAADELGMIPARDPLYYERIGSGEREAVPELKRALADGRAGEYQVLVVLTTSRFARNATEARIVKRDFARAGIAIYFVHDRIISGSRQSLLTEGIKEVIDEAENETRRMWVAGGLRERQLSGRWMGRVPIGYRKLLVDFADGTRGWDGGLEIDPQTAPLVREMYERIAAGEPVYRIAVDFNVRGLRRVEGRAWTPTAIQVIVANPVYKGVLQRYPRERELHYYPNDDPHDGRREVGRPFPAIVDDRLWESVQRDGGGTKWRAFKKHYPLSSVLRCRRCGYRLGGASNGKDRYYRCQGRVLGVCDAPHLRADRAEADFAGWLDSIRLPADWRREMARLEVRSAVAADRDRQRVLEERLARIKNLYAWGDMPEDEYRAEASRLRSEMGVMVKPDMVSLERLAEMLEDVGGLWRSLPEDRRKELPPRIVSRIVCDEALVVEIVARPELQPLVEMGVLGATAASTRHAQYTVRFSA